MKNIGWLFNRLKAMSLGEIFWRVQQKRLKNLEKKEYYTKNISVAELTLSKDLTDLKFSADRLPINWNNQSFSVFGEQDLFGVYSYEKYKKQWNAGFQTDNCWPEDQCSYDISCNQRTDIGDIRTNWELNRHFQFSALAKSYYVTNDNKYLSELEDLFEDWNKHNLFLHGVQWTSAMELAIRVNSWTYTYAFLEKAFQRNESQTNKELLGKLKNGILVMTDYITKHYARFSSANNHLVVEMYAVALSGIVFDYESWTNMAFKILNEELPRQNYSDGVNKEMSLHYQTFVMEAYGLLILTMRKNNIHVPEIWYKYLNNMSCFVADCCGEYGETVVFGDNDEGKILDLCSVHFNHYKYVLDIMSFVLEKRYTDLNDVCENIRWLTACDEPAECMKKDKYVPELVRCYKEGGYTIIRSKDQKVLIGIDHAELGFGRICAHGHADALSFQMFIEGSPVFVDAGTYNYHIMPSDRDSFRSTRSHNTVTADDLNQSEILGPFLWGKRAECRINNIDISADKICLSAQVTYSSIKHIREFIFNYDNRLTVKDTVTGDINNRTLKQLFHLSDYAEIVHKNKNSMIVLNEEHKITVESSDALNMEVQEYEYSPQYNSKRSALKLQLGFSGNEKASITTCITIQ